MLKSAEKFIYIGLLICTSHFVQASDLIEVMDMDVPIESYLSNIKMACTNSERFIECECFYGNETYRLTKVVAKSPRINQSEVKQESRKLLSWVSEHLIPNIESEFVQTDYGKLSASNSWGEVAFVKVCGNELLVTIENIAIAERLNLSGSTSVSFPDDFMGLVLSSREGETNLVKATASILDGANRGRYEYYVWNIPSSGIGQTFFDNGSCELSIRSKSILAIRLNKCFHAEERAKVIDECCKIIIEKCGIVGMRNITNPITGDVIGGTCSVDGRGICGSFQVEELDAHSKLLLKAKFQLPHKAYCNLLAEGTCKGVPGSDAGGCRH